MMAQYLPLCLAIALVAVWSKPLGGYMTAVYLGLPHPLSRPLASTELLLYRCCGIDPLEAMSWRRYAASVCFLGMMGIVGLSGLLMLQGVLPLNPQHVPGLSLTAALNVAISFVTNTNWQSYAGEQLLSYASQTVGLSVQMYLSAATGLSVAVAFCRALASKHTAHIGNFWVDLVRSVLYILLPLSLLFGLILVSQGVVQHYAPYTLYHSLEGGEGLIAGGPVAWHTAIKMLGSNGGGFFGANAAHPFENPNAVTNMLQLAAVLLLPVTFVYSSGLLMRDRRQGWMMLVAMCLLLLPFLGVAWWQEEGASPKFDPAVVDLAEGNMVGKEVRFGTASSALWSVLTTATANGSTNSAHDAYAPLSGMAQMMLMQLGEVVFGGVGSGLYGMLIFVLMTVFMAGLMVGRSPEFLGKKLTPFDIKMVALFLLLPALLTLGGATIAVLSEAGRIAVSNPGPHGFSQILYAFTSASHNNGSSLAGLQTATPFYDLALGICMFLGRYGGVLCVLALAGSFAAKNITPSSAGTLPTHTPLFTLMLVMVVLLIGVLTYVPALALGPIAEHLLLFGGA